MKYNINRRKLLVTSALSVLTPVVASNMSVAATPQTSKSDRSWDETFDVVVIGSGGAGLTAAVTAAEKGAKVLVLEKNSFVGGNTIVSGGAFNAVIPEDAKKAGVQDSEQLFFENTMEAGGYRGNKKLVKKLTENADESVAWLKDHGVEFMDYIYQVYGGLHPRTRNPKLHGGQSYIKALMECAQKLPITIKTNSRVVDIIREAPLEGRVIGVEYVTPDKRNHFIKAKRAVIAASGGYSANAKLCGLFDPRLEHLGTSNLPSATGEILNDMIDLGAQTVGMDYVQCVINKPKDQSTYVPLSIFVDYFIFVNWDGERFIKEDAARDVLCNAFLAEPKEEAFSVMDSKGFDVHCKVGRVEDLLKKSIKTGIVLEANSIEELAKKMGVPVSKLCQSVEAYNRSVDDKADALGRDPKMLVHKIETGPFYAARFAMARHHTMGGVLINEDAQVIDRKGNVIPGLLAAGEVTGGIHGNNRIGGNGIADIFTFGRFAGLTATK